MQVFVDTVGPPVPYAAHLQSLFPTLAFTVCSKADSIYPIVSAASIAAKVTRDKVLEEWVFLEREWERVEGGKGGGVGERGWGSGYPAGELLALSLVLFSFCSMPPFCSRSGLHGMA